MDAKTSSVDDGLAALEAACKAHGLLMVVILAGEPEPGSNLSITGNYAPEDLGGILKAVLEEVDNGKVSGGLQVEYSTSTAPLATN